MNTISVTDYTAGTAKDCVVRFNKAFNSPDRLSAAQYLTDDCQINYCGQPKPYNFPSFCDFINLQKRFQYSTDVTVTFELIESDTVRGTIVEGNICFCNPVSNIARVSIEAVCVKEDGNYRIKKYTIEDDAAVNSNQTLYCDSIPGSIAVFSADDRHTIEFVNDDLCHELGFCCMGTIKYQYGYSINNLVLDADMPVFLDYVTALSEGKRPTDIHIRLKNREYKPVWYAVRGKTQNSTDGQSVVLLCYNIEGLKNTSSQTDKKSHEVSVILENLPAMSHRFDMRSRKLDFVSEDFCSVTGYLVKEIEEKFDNHYLPMVHEDDRQTIVNALAALSLVQQTMTVSYRLICKDGTVLPVRDTIRSVHHNYDGRWEGYSSLSIVREEKKTEEKKDDFFEYDEYPRPLFVGMYNGRDMHCLFMNNSAKEIFVEGHAPESGTLCDMCSTKDDHDGMLNSLHQLYKGKKKASGITNINVGNRDKRFLYSMFIKSFDGDEMTFTLLLFDGDELQEIHDGITPEKRIRVRTFGYFDVFVDGKAIPFRNSKGKELLALLVDRRGGIVTSKDIVSALWENDPVDTTTLSRARKVVMRLMEELREYGIEEMVNSDSKGQKSINSDLIDCDLYRYLDDRKGNRGLFNGSYMTNYSWGEYTLADLWPEI